MTCALPWSWAFPAWLAPLLEIVGTALIMFGLALTWWEWSDGPARQRLRQLAARFRRRNAVFATGGAVAVAAGVTGRAEVLPRRPGPDATTEEVVSYCEALASNLGGRIRYHVEQQSEQISRQSAKSQERDSALSERLEAVSAEHTQATRRLAVGGLGWAAVGATLALVAVLLGGHWLCS